ncbi:MAG: hypothetical protein KDC27_19550 [Acidobacteria bacterium]|nr:hypothetical protein [Acidobacteriota bacterium]
MRKLLLLVVLAAPFVAAAADRSQPPLFFREDWTETPPNLPVTDADLTNKDLTVSRWGPGGSVIKKSFHDNKPEDPYYIWSGLCPGTWAVSLRKKGAMVDLRAGKVRWRSKQAGFRELRIVVQTADGKWMVSDQSDGPADDWRVREFVLADVRWRALDIEKVTEGAWVKAPDLSRVAEVGFTDLTVGGRSAACSRLDWIEVYGVAVSGNTSD